MVNLWLLSDYHFKWTFQLFLEYRFQNDFPSWEKEIEMKGFKPRKWWIISLHSNSISSTILSMPIIDSTYIFHVNLLLGSFQLTEYQLSINCTAISTVEYTFVVKIFILKQLILIFLFHLKRFAFDYIFLILIMIDCNSF